MLFLNFIKLYIVNIIPIVNVIIDTSKLKQLGWNPEVTLEEGLKRHYEWFKEQDV